MQLQRHLLWGDCFELLPSLPDCFDCVFVDPPYNIGIDYGNGRRADELPEDEYLGLMDLLISLCVEKLGPAGSLWFLVPERLADPIGAVLTEYLPRRNRIIWRETFGQYRDDRFASGHRHLFWHVKSLKDSPFYTDDIRVPSQRMIHKDSRAAGPRVPDDVWEFPRLVGNAAETIGGHPCQLPEALLERVIRSCCKEGDVVLDPMCGTGTTLRVAQRLGLEWVGIERQARFCKLIEERVSRDYQPMLF